MNAMQSGNAFASISKNEFNICPQLEFFPFLLNMFRWGRRAHMDPKWSCFSKFLTSSCVISPFFISVNSSLSSLRSLLEHDVWVFRIFQDLHALEMAQHARRSMSMSDLREVRACGGMEFFSFPFFQQDASVHNFFQQAFYLLLCVNYKYSK